MRKRQTKWKNEERTRSFTETKFTKILNLPIVIIEMKIKTTVRYHLKRFKGLVITNAHENVQSWEL